MEQFEFHVTFEPWPRDVSVYRLVCKNSSLAGFDKFKYEEAESFMCHISTCKHLPNIDVASSS